MINTINSWLACVVLLWGLKLIGEKKRAGLYVALVAEMAWIVWGICTASWAIVAMSIVICGMYIRAIRLWGKP